jgi:hypothetical protein
MDAKQIRTMLRTDKLHPFDVRTAGGDSYHVRSPEMVWMPPRTGVMMVYDLDQGISFIDIDQVVECAR